MQNSPKIHFIKNSEGKFLNSRNMVYYPSIVNANYDRDKKVLDDLIETRFKGHEVHTITEHEFMEEMASKTTNCVLSGEYFSKLLTELSFILPTVSQVNKTMYQKCKSTVDVLTPFTKMHQDFIKQKEDDTDDVQGHYAEFISEMSKVEIYQMAEVVATLKAYQKDRSSVLGIVRKVLSH